MFYVAEGGGKCRVQGLKAFYFLLMVALIPVILIKTQEMPGIIWLTTYSTVIEAQEARCCTYAVIVLSPSLVG